MVNRFSFSRVLIAASFIFVGAAFLFGTDFYVAPNGSPSGNGSINSPWDLKTALNQPAAVHAGDTIWLRGGTYTTAVHQPSEGHRGQPHHRAAVHRASARGSTATTTATQTTLIILGPVHLVLGFRGLQLRPTRYTSDGDCPPRRGPGTQNSGNGTRMINMIVHDTSQGVLTGEDATDSRIYGTLFYYNGYDSPDRGHGHGIYAQNVGSTPKHIYDNIIFRQYGWGIHAYGEGGHLDNIDFQGNVSFNNGELSGSFHTNILYGGMNLAHNPKLISNFTYNSDDQNNNDLGYSAGCTSPTIQNNYFVNDTALGIINCSGMTITGNTFVGKTSGFSQSGFPSNTYYPSTLPTGVKVFVRPNAYEAKRANIVVYNWDMQNTVNVDVSGILSNGDGYEVRNAADFFGAPVLQGTYSAGTLALPMTGLSVAAPVGVGRASPDGKAVQRLRPASGLSRRIADADGRRERDEDPDEDADPHGHAHTDPHAHENGHGRRADPHPDAHPDQDSNADGHSHADQDSDAERLGRLCPNRGRVADRHVAHGDQIGQRRVWRQIYRFLDRQFRQGGLDVQRPDHRNLRRVGPRDRAQYRGGFVVREDGFGCRGRLRRGAGHVGPQLAVVAGQRTGHHGRSVDAESQDVFADLGIAHAHVPGPRNRHVCRPDHRDQRPLLRSDGGAIDLYGIVLSPRTA